MPETTHSPKRSKGDGEPSPFGNSLAAQLQAGEELLVTLHIVGLQIVKQLAAEGDHAEQATASAVIFRIARQVLGQMIDTIRETNDLHIGATGVFFVQFERLGILENNLAH